MNCTHCGKPAECVTLRALYGSKKYPTDRYAWRCRPCGAHVGCHPETTIPLGTMAKEPLRRARNEAHAVFDPLWRKGHYTRKEAYRLLAEYLDIPFSDCHIALFDETKCKAVVAFSQEQRAAIFRNNMRGLRE